MSPNNEKYINMVRFDAYSATTTAAKYSDLLGILVGTAQALPPSLRQVPPPGNTGAKVPWENPITLKQGKGFHTFGERISVLDDTGVELGAVSWGGRQGERVMLEVKGESTPKVVERLRSDFPHRCTRVDSCADFDAPGAFERLLDLCTPVKRQFDLTGEKRGDWEDHPEQGRTWYIHAKPNTLRLYEKGLTKEYLHLGMPNWTRIELEVHPTKTAKERFASLDPIEVWGASAWSREIAARVLREHVDPHTAGSVHRQSSFERRWHWMCVHYGATWMEALGEYGTYECVGRNVEDYMRLLKRRRGQ